MAAGEHFGGRFFTVAEQFIRRSAMSRVLGFDEGGL
jgi:hypothetical protein